MIHAALRGALLLLMLALCARAQTLQTLVSNGPTAQRINVTFFSEGYTAAELPSFLTNVTTAVDTFFSTPPFNVYRRCFNIHAVSVASAQSGSDHHTPTTRLANTYFNSSFDSYGVDRVLTIPPNNYDGAYANGQGKVDALVASLNPESDIEVVLVNDRQYGGSGGARLVASLDASSAEIVMHELGHTFAGLGDEYSDYFAYSDIEEPNTTQETERSLIKWNAWILPSTPVPTPDVPENFSVVGLFEGAHYHATGWYRPQHNCKMRSLGAPYCAVCAETAVLSIYRLIRPIDAHWPEPSIVTLTNALTFAIAPLSIGSDTYRYQWFTNGVAVPSANSSNLLLTPQMLGPGAHAVRVEVHDETPFVRTDPSRLLFDTNSWSVSVPATLAISRQPQSQVVAAGDSASFAVEAKGATPIYFQWRFNGTSLSGETNSTLTLANVTEQHSGSYDVIVSNAFAAQTSHVATLIVEVPSAPEIIQSPVSTTVYAGNPATFTVVASGSAPRTYFWRKGSDVVAATATGTFVIASAAFEDAGIYSVLVSNALGVAESASAELSVAAVPSITAGVYNGLFFDSNNIATAPAGSFSVTVAADRTFRAQLQVGTVKRSFRGIFGNDGRATNFVATSAPLEVQLRVDAENADVLFGQVSDGSGTAPLLARRATFHGRTNPATAIAGTYTFLMAGAADATNAPTGLSFASLRIDANGRATLAGTLADGTRLSARSTVVGSGDLPVYAAIPSVKGAVLGWLRIKPNGLTDVDGTAFWIRPPDVKARIYPQGFAMTSSVAGSTYAKSTGTLFDIALARLVLDGAAAEPRTNHITLGLNGTIASAGPDNVRLKLNAATGLFKGTVTPATEKPIRVQGAILQRQRYGGGFFVATNQAGRVYFGP